MKKAILTMLAIGATTSLFAQGQLKFANTATTLVMTNDLQGHVGAALGSTFHVALYWGVLGSTEAQLVQIGPSGVGTVAGLAGVGSGRFTAGSTAYVTGTATPINGTATFEVKGWTGNYASYDAAYAAAIGGDTSVLLGTSGLFNLATGGGGTPTVPPPSDLTAGGTSTLTPAFTGLTLAPVPEPTTIALAGLGAASLLLFRRRK
jgi:PEP-CTERM motif